MEFGLLPLALFEKSLLQHQIFKKIKTQKMKSTIKIIITSCLLLTTSYLATAQVGINSDNSNPDASAMLDVSSTDKGLLIPRMDSTSRQGISNPANGLLVFDTDFNSFWYYTNSTWLNLNAALMDADNDTKIQVEESSDEDIIRFDLGGTEFLRLDSGRIEIVNTGNSVFIGEGAGVNGNNNVFIGNEAGYSNTTGIRNIFLGSKTGYSNTTGLGNLFFGHEAGYSNTTGDGNYFSGVYSGYANTIGKSNTFIEAVTGRDNTTGENNTFLGAYSGLDNTTGYNNTFLGAWSGLVNTTGIGNTFLGVYSGEDITTGIGNTFVGISAGRHNSTGEYNVYLGAGAGFSASGSQNVFIGYSAGYDEDGDNKLYIDNSDNSSPLIYGDFDADSLQINGTLNISGNYAFPTTDGSGNQVLATDGNGTLSWLEFYDDQAIDVFSLNGNNLEISIEDDGLSNLTADLSSIRPFTLADTDGDTKIQVEESSNEDIIRFDLGGTEFFRLDNGRIETVNTGGSIFIGEGAGANDDLLDNQNVFLGYQTGYNNDEGVGNIFTGYQTGYNNTTGANNTFLGYQAGYANTTGLNNLMFGTLTGYNNDAGSYNLFMGVHAGYGNTSGNHNIGIGFQSGFTNSTGEKNVFLGYQAGYSETGSNKLYIDNSNSSSPLLYGEFDNDLLRINGKLSITGEGSTTEFITIDKGRIATLNTGNSVFIGENAGLNDDYSENVNVFVGYKAGENNTLGDRNTFIGAETGQYNTTGTYNTFVGFKAGNRLETGFDNAFYGHRTGFFTTTGGGNTFLGFEAGYQNETGDYNVFLGHHAGYYETQSNKLYIENSSTTSPLIYGEFDTDILILNGTSTINGELTVNSSSTVKGLFEATTSTAGENNYILTIENTKNNNSDFNNGLLIEAGHDSYNSGKQSSLIRFQTPNGTSCGRIRQDGGNDISLITSSDRRLKENIKPTHYSIEDILKIEVKDYNFITDPDDLVKTGFIAQQLHTIFPATVSVGDDVKTNPWGVNYAGLTPLLVKGMQDQQQMIDQLNETIQRQQAEINALKAQLQKVNELEAKVEALLKKENQ